jgi:Tfp pilus assembly protein PilX
VIARPKRRRGLTTVAVLALLIVLGLIASTIVALSATYHARSRTRDRASQSEALADAGLDRAFARLAADPEYKGERWEIPAASLGLPAAEGAGPAAVVTIAVESEGEARTVRVQADHPVEPERRARSSRRVVLPEKP